MTAQYWVGGFFIDPSRNQITQNNNSQTIAPKALAVLTYLAEHQGKVVSHEELLAKVWPDTVASPNTLQRNIAQLRKALGDDGKVQVYIKTHAKQGYSLECDVRWQKHLPPVSADESSENENADEIRSQHSHTETPTTEASHSQSAQSPQSRLPVFSVVAGILALAIIGYQFLLPKPNATLKFETLRSLTATDDKEFDANYSPDGEYIVFHRYLDKQCVNKVWAKNIRTQQETQLTKDWGAYGPHSFSPDGKQLVFLATGACNQPVIESNCYNLVSLDFEKALASPQQPEVILQCKNSSVKKPTWLNDGNIALLQRESDRWDLIKYDTKKGRSSDIYSLQEGNIVHYAYSPQEDLIALTRFHPDGSQHLDMLKPDGHLVSSHPISVPSEIPKTRPLYPNFSPLENQLVFSTGRQLFTLSYEGNIEKVSLPFAERMVQPEFHPKGKRLLMIKGPYDSDISQLSLEQLTQLPQGYPSIERSNLGEGYASFQPNGNLIAFWSERSGDNQLWVSDGKNPRQLTQFPMDTYIRGIEWAKDGQSLLVNANNQLTQVFLDARQKTLPMKYPAVLFYDWDSESNHALILARIEGLLKLAEYNLNSDEYQVINDKAVLWAQKSKDGEIIYKDVRDQYWRPGAIEDQHISALDNLRGDAKSFVMDGNTLYAISSQEQLWSYDLDTDTFLILGKVGKEVDSLSDVRDGQVLMEIQVAAKKEVVELVLGE
ncbi:winged helix-turn-helix domain-containing protein [Pseudoteredinibacter isoporae]|uniref:DNA-binding winged helix-turn-helix (WHTH) protein/Tol biopolymer transport system component n=1 Tax=Pseudoteredinibacter isoporae TaxID=570281 RepID=A0A7X0JYI5_9GAMM|nr:winged helix-turn-helix domain-containing protein [Pseudoteredinibacter isoporae]MBB6523796.1 DNA-binding winged helix-turn-helix (wHTH) protein/Tol biopolymer transport system component [Pseudoteredinibacter isoporae]NHO89316.1 transcriptional regulator [Pseudoteredinibacter isoporae]NIB22423.1 transcriptional regulator [Pseudoteredinibacter isoporae]